jgi:N-acetylglucosaminyldiphosphoundecaprenol N-acetyl-beta-D-mannosaminyltransferase
LDQPGPHGSLRPAPATADPVERGIVAGTAVAVVTFDEVLDRCLRAAREGGGRIRVHFCTTHTLVEAEADPSLRGLLEASDAIAAPDGLPLVWVLRRRGMRVERVCGPDFLPALADRGREIGARHFFFGGEPGVAEDLARKLSARYPGLVVAGTWCPPFRSLTPDEDREEVARINDARPDFVWVGLGSPKQDHWLAEHRDRLDAAALFAVGAAFNFHTGRVRRAPRWMQRTGTEWLFRLVSEPRRLARRYAVANTRFIALLFRDLRRSRTTRRAAAGR